METSVMVKKKAAREREREGGGGIEGGEKGEGEKECGVVW